MPRPDWTATAGNATKPRWPSSPPLHPDVAAHPWLRRQRSSPEARCTEKREGGRGRGLSLRRQITGRGRDNSPSRPISPPPQPAFHPADEPLHVLHGRAPRRHPMRAPRLPTPQPSAPRSTSQLRGGAFPKDQRTRTGCRACAKRLRKLPCFGGPAPGAGTHHDKAASAPRALTEGSGLPSLWPTVAVRLVVPGRVGAAIGPGTAWDGRKEVRVTTQDAGRRVASWRGVGRASRQGQQGPKRGHSVARISG